MYKTASKDLARCQGARCQGSICAFAYIVYLQGAPKKMFISKKGEQLTNEQFFLDTWYVAGKKQVNTYTAQLSK